MAVLKPGMNKGGYLVRCADCKWWTPPKSERSFGWGRCELAQDRDDEYDWKGNTAGRLCLPIGHGEGATGADLLVMPDFGCVQFEPKP